MEENIEFKDREYRPEEDLAEKQQETSFWDSPIRQQREKSLWETPDAPKFEPTADHPRLAAQREEFENIGTEDQLKKFIQEKLGVGTSKTAGPESRDLYDNSKIVLDKRSGNISGIEYKGVKVVVEGGRISTNKKNQASIEKFKLALKNAEQEYEKSLDSVVDKNSGTFDEHVDETVKQDFKETLDRDMKTDQRELEEKMREISRLNELVKSAETKVTISKRNEERFQDKLAEKKDEIRKLTKELGKQAVSQGREISEKERENNAKIQKLKDDIEKTKSESEGKLLAQIRILEEESRTKNAKQIRDLEAQIVKARESEKDSKERLELLRTTLKQVEDENLQLQLRLEKNENPATRDRINRLEKEKKTLQDQLDAERKSRIEAQSLLDKQKQNLDKTTMTVFTNKETREINGAIKNNILERQDLSPQKKLDLIQTEQKYWHDKFDREQVPARKSTFESLKSFYANQMDRQFAEMGEPPQFPQNKEKLAKLARRNEIGRFLRFVNFLKRNYKIISTVGTLASIVIAVGSGVTQYLYSGRKVLEKVSDKIMDLSHSFRETIRNYLEKKDVVVQELKQDEQQNVKLQAQVRQVKTEQKQQIQTEKKDLAAEKKKLADQETKMKEEMDKTQRDSLEKELDEQKKIVHEKTQKVEKLEQQLQRQESIEKHLVAMETKMQEQDQKFIDLQQQAIQQAQKHKRLEEKLADETQLSKEEKETIQQQLREVQESLQKIQQQSDTQQQLNRDQKQQLDNFEQEIRQLLQNHRSTNMSESKIEQLLAKHESKIEAKMSEAQRKTQAQIQQLLTQHKTQNSPDPEPDPDPSSILPFAWQRKVGKNLLKYLGIAVVFLLKYLGTVIFWIAGNLITVSILGFSFILYKVFRRQKK